MIKKQKFFFIFLVIVILLIIFFFSYNTKPVIPIPKIQADQSATDNSLGLISKETKTSKLPVKKIGVIQDTDLDRDKGHIQKLIKSYCLLESLKVNFPYSKKSGFAGYIGPEIKHDGNIGDEVMNLAIEDSSCPFGKYSVVNARKKDGIWVKESELDCRTASSEDVFLAYGRQQALEFKDNHQPLEFHLGINGPGFFITSCLGNFIISRWGSFVMDKQNRLVDRNGCYLVNNKLAPIKVKNADQISEDYPFCFRGTGECVPIIQNQELKKLNLIFLGDKQLILGRGNPKDIAKLKEIILDEKKASKNTQIINDARETLEDPTLLETGISTEAFEEINTDFKCDSIL